MTQGRTTLTMPVIIAETTRATVLFTDMRGYTGLAERLPPARLVPLLDEFFGVLARATATYGGEVFHMAGDGMMAGFGVRDPHQHGAREVLAASRLMLQRFSAVAEALGSGSGLGTKRGTAPFLLLPQFEMRGRTGLLDIWCVPAPERVSV